MFYIKHYLTITYEKERGFIGVKKEHKYYKKKVRQMTHPKC